MNYVSSLCTDVGIKKSVNQDAALIRQAQTNKGNVLFAVICDGMGGLKQGEVASSSVISRMSEWFEHTFPDILYHHFTPDSIKESWISEILKINDNIHAYGKKRNIDLGTTMVALLLVEDAYYICNVGDSRVYYLKDGIHQMTHDQSYVQREIDMGRMTREEARESNQRNMLLQCIGASTNVIPDFYVGEYQKDSAFVLCSDGFRHVLSEQEIWQELKPDELFSESVMEDKLNKLIEVIKKRGEEDNISTVLIHAL